jgi:translation initiation factor 1
VSGSDSRSVYETGRGRLCPRCGLPAHARHCSSRAESAVPAKIACVLRLEKKGRAGKSVTVVARLPRNAPFLAGLAAELKKACGTGGTATDDGVEVQGDQREKLRPLLAAKGWTVRG